ncbi:hypothetical protein BDN72DRAFT_464323 [Pluteus cervinus]|uniref:Uncharacterized protein n=1 Tax=Pluteus cervinus TaxID=181527 RepID=A0ACD3B1A5_9AGAR|nr:hypothetical protein BDN72DRAFT_464323 [Pluteus cervinus]
MFTTLTSPYSPFFTSGLLSDQCSSSPSPSRCSSPEFFPGPRRGSLPTDSSAEVEEAARAKRADESLAFYQTLQPKRDTSEYRSFLSLDLAESQSLRSVSMRRKTGSMKSSKPRFDCIPEHPVPALPTSPLRARFSRDSLRALPSPKPAPSVSLPEPPKMSPTTSQPPRLPSIPRTPTLRMSSLEPAPLSPVRISTPPQSNKRSRHGTLVSTASTTTRGINRSDALARLEGQLSPKRKAKKPKTIRTNFMSMSDDESDMDDLVFVLNEKAEMGLPLSKRLSSTHHSNTRRRPDGSALHLNSFIDFYTDNDQSWKWRSFIEIVS